MKAVKGGGTEKMADPNVDIMLTGSLLGGASNRDLRLLVRASQEKTRVRREIRYTA